MTPAELLSFMWRERGTAIMRAADQQLAADAMDAAVRGGFRSVEFTMTTPGVLELIAEFSQRDELAVGAGTVLTIEDARAAVGAGARFLVSPVTDLAIIEEARALGVAIAPGTYTPTEMWRAHSAGAQLQKLFPVSAAGPDTIRALLGPMPFLRIVPTNGVNLDNVGDYIRAGAFGAGFVSALFSPDDMANRAFDRIEQRAALMHREIMTAERPPNAREPEA
jgi:Entner-Doudoroff aldolase